MASTPTLQLANVDRRHGRARYPGRPAAEFIRVGNVTDKKYIGSVIVNEANGGFHEPALEHAMLLGVNASYLF